MSALLAVMAALLSAGCGDETVILTTTGGNTGTTPYERQTIDYFKGVTETASTEWSQLSADADLLRRDGINTVSIEPPVLITERAGGTPRVILEGARMTAPGVIEDLHRAGLAVFLAPTTASPGFQEEVNAGDSMMEHLTEDTLEWADTAEEEKVELFTPLSRCNIALGTDACRSWLQSILPGIREHYTGAVAAKVAADIADAPMAGGQHDFELLDYRGYDYLVIDIHPWGHVYNEERFRAYVAEVLDRAEAIAARDGLKGVMVGDLRLPRNNNEGTKLETGTWLNEEQQAEVADMVLTLALPRTRGFFFFGWTTAGYGARGYPVEDMLSRHFGGEAASSPAIEGASDSDGGTDTTAGTGTDTGAGATGDSTIVENR